MKTHTIKGHQIKNHNHEGHEHHNHRAHNSNMPIEEHDHSVCLLEEEKKKSNWQLAIQATLHCLLGCGIGEIVGVILGVVLGLGMWETMILGMSLGFVFGFSLGIIPLIRNGFGFNEAFKMILVSEGLSVLVMESAEVITQIYIPGVMEASITQGLFWFGMGISLLAGFMAALPVNVILIRRGIRHHH